MSIFGLLINPWKIGTIAAGAVIAGLLVTLGVLYIEKRHLTKVAANLDAQINDPVRGYKTVIATKDANYESLRISTGRQTQALRDQSTADRAKLADTTAKLAAAQRATLAAQKQVAVFMSKPPAGNTVCEQYEDIDRRALETLK